MTITESTKMETIEFASKGENITVIERLVDDLCEKHHIQEEHYGNILIALTEAVNNAIYHGNKQDPDKKVVVKYLADADQFTFIKSWISKFRKKEE